MTGLLRPATHDEYLQQTRKNFPEWGSTLSLDQYLNRELSLLKTRYGKTSTCWVLVIDSEVKCSCETYPRRCIYSSADGLEEGLCWSVASVFTDPEHRGKGYASRMMELLYERCKIEGCIASNLYSDVGHDFYARFGWKSHQSNVLEIDPFSYYISENEPDIVPVKLHEVDQLLKNFRPKENGFWIKPTVECIEWFFARSKFYADNVNKISNFDSEYHIGVKRNEDFVLWFIDFPAKKLYLLLVYGDYQEPLITAAVLQAKKIPGIEKVCVWNATTEIQKFGTLSVRESSISQLAIFKNVKDNWIINEKFGWV